MNSSTFFIWASRRGIGATLPNVAKLLQRSNVQKRWLLPPRRRAFRYNVFWHPSPYGRIAYAHANTIFTGVSHTPPCQKTFPLQSLSHARPRHLPVSRRTNQSLRSHINPSPRTPRPGPSLKIMGTSPASGYRYATAGAVGRGSDSSWPCGCATART